METTHPLAMDRKDNDLLFSDDPDHKSIDPRFLDHSFQQSVSGCRMSLQSEKGSRTTPFLSSPDLDGINQNVSIPSFNPISEVDRLARSGPTGLCLPPGQRNREWLISRIEDVFEQQLDGILANNRHLSLTLLSRSHELNSSNCSVRILQFPGNSEKDAWRYTVTIRLLELVHEALVTQTVITKRDIYYRDPALFSNQRVVNRYIDNIARTLGVSRVCLNVAATAKGLIVGNFKIHRHDGTLVDGRIEREGNLISRLGDDDIINVDQVQWVLVVEKEATFRSLISSGFWSALSSHGLLVTAKGYPDIATRSLLRSVALPSRQNNFKERAVYALMDYDPDGIEILSTYKHGSIALDHEKSNLELPPIRWLGLHSQDIGQHFDLHQSQGLLFLSTRDRQKANRMLERQPFLHNGKEPLWRRELQVMLFLNIKAEIQLLEAQPNGLAVWLNSKGVK